MIDHPSGFAMIMHDVARSRLLTAELLGTYTLIAGYAGLDGECWTPQETLADMLGCSVRTLQRYLRALVDGGFLTERFRRESQRETKGRAYALSDTWREPLPDSHDTGVVRLSIQSESHTTPVTDSHDKISKSHTTPVSPVKRTRLKEPDKNTEASPPAGTAADPPPVVDAPVGPRQTDTARSRTRLKSSAPPVSPELQAVLDHYREEWGDERPLTLNPAQTRLLQEAVDEVGVDLLKASVTYFASLKVREIDKARRGALTRAGKNPRRAAQLGAQSANRGSQRGLTSAEVNAGRTGYSSGLNGPIPEDVLAQVRAYEARHGR